MLRAFSALLHPHLLADLCTMYIEVSLQITNSLHSNVQFLPVLRGLPVLLPAALAALLALRLLLLHLNGLRHVLVVTVPQDRLIVCRRRCRRVPFPSLTLKQIFIFGRLRESIFRPYFGTLGWLLKYEI